MTPEQINIAIAQACGFTAPFCNTWLHEADKEGGDVWAFCGVRNGEHEPLPNYHGDLNAMHEAEEVLMADWNLMNAYQNHELPKFVKSTNSNWLCRATAAQRAEAFLKTLGLWKESKP